MERKVLLGKKLGIFYEKKGFVGKKFFQRMRCVRDAQRVILSLSSCRHQGSLHQRLFICPSKDNYVFFLLNKVKLHLSNNRLMVNTRAPYPLHQRLFICPRKDNYGGGNYEVYTVKQSSRDQMYICIYQTTG